MKTIGTKDVKRQLLVSCVSVFITTLLVLCTIPSVSAASFNVTSGSDVKISAGGSFSVKVEFNNGSDSDLEIEVTGYGDLKPNKTSDSVLNQSVLTTTFEFTAPRDMPSDNLTLYFVGKNASGKVGDAEVKVKVTNDDISKMHKYISFSNIECEDVVVGGSVSVKGTVMNNSDYDMRNVVLVVDGQNSKTISLGKIAAGSSSDFSVVLDAYNRSGNQRIDFELSYDDPEGNSDDIDDDITIYVSESEEISFSGEKLPTNIYAGADTTIKFNLVNRSNEDFTNTEVVLMRGTTELATVFVGKVGAQSSSSVEMVHVFDTPGDANYTLRARYTNRAGENKVDKTINLYVKESSSLVIQNIVVPDDIASGVVSNIKFNIVNNGAALTNAQAYISRNGSPLVNKYIGNIGANDRVEMTLSYAYTEGGTYTIIVEYTDASGNSRIQENYTVRINGKSTGASVLKIQSILPPSEPLINSVADIKFAITNPTNLTITGAEAALYNSSGKMLNSIYISTLEPNAMSSQSISINSPSVAGTNSYTLKVTYKNQSGKTETLSKSLSIRTVAEKSEESEKPSDVKILKIEAPMVAYTNVRCTIPYTLVNSGKGTAYNVEIYALDKDGNELAREYVGTLQAAAQTTGLTFYVKSLEVGEYTAALCVEYEHFDGTKAYIEKDFTQNVIDYRASVGDISGLDWAEVGYATTVEFSVQNSGTEKLLNTTARLMDDEGNVYGEQFIGTVEPSTKLERQKIKNVVFNNSGEIPLTIVVEYENTDMQVFTFSGKTTVNVQEPYVPPMEEFPMPGEEGVTYDEFGNPIPMEEEKGGIPTWIWFAIGGVVVLAAIIMVVAIRKKKAKKQDDDDVDSFLSEMMGTSLQPAPAQEEPDYDLGELLETSDE